MENEKIDDTVEIEIKKLHFIMIEAADISTAFTVFKDKLSAKDVFVSEFDLDSFVGSFDRNGADRHSIAMEFIQTTGLTREPIVWGGKYAESKESTLLKKFTEENVVQNGTKKWETRYVLIGETTGKRYDVTNTTKGEAVDAAKVLVITAKENILVNVEKVLISHDPAVSKLNYIKDKTEHDNIFMFLCNTVDFDERSMKDIMDDNMVLDKLTGQWSIKVETIFEYEERIKI